MTVNAKVSGTNDDRYVVELRAGHHALVADEPEALGGTDSGPAPFALVVSGLAACTAITLRMYAERKGWPLETTRVALTMTTDDDDGQQIERVLTLEGDLDDEQRTRLLAIAEKTPVTRLLKRAVALKTRLTV